MRTGSTSAHSLLLAVLLIGTAGLLRAQSDPDDSYWDGRFGPPGIDGPVFASAAHDNTLFLAGRFSSTAQIPTHNIVLWNRDDFHWDSLASGLDGEVRALLVVGNHLYVGGNFRHAGGIPANFLARWDITTRQWSPVGTGTDTTVWELVEHNGEIYIGGEFHRAGGVKAENLAVYTPSTGGWRGEFDTVYAPNYGFEPTVITAIAFDGEDLYIGGQFEYLDATAGGSPFANWVHASCIAQRVNGRWSDLSGVWPNGPPFFHGVTGKVWKIIPMGDRILMSGEFRASDHDGRYYDSAREVIGEEDRPQSLSCPGFTVWNKVERFWYKVPLKGGFNLRLPAYVYDMTVFRGRVYLGGIIRGSGADNTIGVAEWDPSQNGEGIGIFRPLPPGSLDGNAIAWSFATIGTPNDDELLIAGDFSRAGDLPAANATLFNGQAFRPLSNQPDNGTDNTIFAATPFRGALVVAGSFARAGGHTASAIAQWDGNNWTTLGNGNELHGAVRALLARGNELFVAGRFSLNGTPANIARFDGNAWSTLADGLNDTVFALASLGNDIVAAGSFTRSGSTNARHIARWNGTAWTELGLNGANNTVYALASAGSSLLYAGGSFSTIGGINAANVAEFDGNAWRALATGTTGPVFALATIGSGSTLTLYAGGDFLDAGGTRAPYLAAWSRAARTWSPLSSGTGLCSPVRALLAQGSTLTVAGEFTVLDQLLPGFLAQWDGNAWHLLGAQGGNGTAGPVYALAPDGPTALYAAGRFLATAGGPANRIARWDGAQWAALGAVATGGLNNPVNALALDNTYLYAGGSFSRAGTVETPNIARFSRASGGWQPLGEGTNGPVHALLLHQGKLYVGGDFDRIGTLRLRNLAAWNIATEQWEAVGSATANGTDGPVYALAANGNELYIGGAFAHGPDSLVARNLVGWNSATAQSFSLGGADSSVRALAVSGGVIGGGRHLFAGGEFQNLNVETGAYRANYIGRFDLVRRVWERLGAGMSDPVLALGALEQNVYVGGPFLVAGTIQPQRVARWDDRVEFWDYLGSGVPGTVRTTVMSVGARGREVFVGGNFQRAGEASAGLIARWDTVERVWRGLGSGLTMEGGGGEVRVMVMDGEGVWVGGNFSTAGQRGSLYIAHWTKPSPNKTTAGINDATPGGSTDIVLAGRPWPNPATERVTLSLQVRQSTDLELAVFDARGVEQARLIERGQRLEAGAYEINWQPESDIPAGLYLLRLRFGESTRSFPVSLVR